MKYFSMWYLAHINSLKQLIEIGVDVEVKSKKLKVFEELKQFKHNRTLFVQKIDEMLENENDKVIIDTLLEIKKHESKIKL